MKIKEELNSIWQDVKAYQFTHQGIIDDRTNIFLTSINDRIEKVKMEYIVESAEHKTVEQIFNEILED